jgi:hypothetical protein
MFEHREFMLCKIFEVIFRFRVRVWVFCITFLVHPATAGQVKKVMGLELE